MLSNVDFMADSELSQLETLADELAAAAKRVAAHCRRARTSLLHPSPADTAEVERGRQSILNNAASIEQMLRGPTDFLQQLAVQNQVLACVQWLCEFQVLACIPLQGSVPYVDVADIVDVPEAQLRAAACMTATAGFLQEPMPGHVAHSPLSAQFVTNPSMLDAVIFLYETAALAAWKMPAATREFGNSQRHNQSSYNVAFDSDATFAANAQRSPKLQRQVQAYFQLAVGDHLSHVTDLLMCLDWASFSEVTVVGVGEESTALASSLTAAYPHLHLRTHNNECPLNGHTATPTIEPAAGPPLHLSSFNLNTVRARSNASVYLLHIPSPTPWEPSQLPITHAIADLKSHFPTLATNPVSRVVVTTCILPNPKTTSPSVAALAHHRSLSLYQLSNAYDRSIDQVNGLLHGIRDSAGGLVLTNEIYSPTSPVVAFEMRFQAFLEHSGS